MEHLLAALADGPDGDAPLRTPVIDWQGLEARFNGKRLSIEKLIATARAAYHDVLTRLRQAAK